MKRLIIVLVICSLLAGGFFMLNKASATKTPYDNGFYSGPYKPELPKIDPTK